jgi:DHA3 family macrolide efflux protein-like MFS transporter
MKQPKQNPLEWKIPFFSVWTAQQLSWIGSSLAQFALVWWLTETTGSATVLAMGMLISVLPGVFAGPFAGALVDRWDRRHVMIIADGLIALVSAWLAYLFWAGAMQPWHVYIIMLARAMGSAFHWPAMQASTSLMVPKEHLSRVAGLSQAMGGAVNIMSPPLGALLLKVLPLHSIMGIDVVTAGLAIAPLLFVHVPQPQRNTCVAGTADGKSTLWVDMREGLRYVRHWPGLLAICTMAMLLNFSIHPAMSLMPILVTEHFGGGALQLGWMNSAWGIGALVGGLLLSAWGGFRRRIVTMLVGIVGLGAGVLVVGLTPATAFPLALAAFLLGAIMNSMCNGSAFALLQQVVAPEMQGRVFTLVLSLCSAMTPISLSIAGPAADALGIRTLYVVGGVSQMLMGLTGFLVPVIMHLEDNYRAQVAPLTEAPAAATA